jgi:hypothetical protein
MRLKGIYLLMKINERGNCQGEFQIVLRFSNKRKKCNSATSGREAIKGKFKGKLKERQKVC